jgi:hypothetical protein
MPFDKTQINWHEMVSLSLSLCMHIKNSSPVKYLVVFLLLLCGLRLDFKKAFMHTQ